MRRSRCSRLSTLSSTSSRVGSRRPTSHSHQTMLPQRAYSISGSDRIQHVQPKSFFAVNEKLAEKRSNPHRLLHVFLEGTAGAGKNAMLHKLQNMGYSVSLNQYYKLFNQHATLDNRDNPCWRFEMNMQFCNQIYASLLRAEEDHKKGQVFKSNIHVYSRSFLSPYVYTKSPLFANWMYEINKLYNVGVVICNADIIQVQSRLAEREHTENTFLKDSLTNNREILGEKNVDYLKQSAADYATLLNSPSDKEFGVCGMIHTTSVKQGTAALMTQLGLKYQGFEHKS